MYGAAYRRELNETIAHESAHLWADDAPPAKPAREKTSRVARNGASKPPKPK